MTLTDKFNLKTMTYSQTASDNGYWEQFIPSDEVIDNLMVLHRDLLVPLVKALPGEIRVNCAYRCTRTNIKVGGKDKSQHLKGMAADVEYWENGKEENKKLMDKVRELNLDYDQMIDERGWVHLSYNLDNNRKMFFKL